MSNGNDAIITLDNLFEAYRKAKADVFFEKSQPLAVEFSRYERNLRANLIVLMRHLTLESPTWHTNPDFVGGYGFLPKALKLTPKPKRKKSADGVCHFNEADPARSWELLLAQNDATAEFRAVAHFTVDMYIVCSLWVNTIGHKFDACLRPSARGSRLRRVGIDDLDKTTRPYHARSLGSFRPYYFDYRKWRQTGLNVIRYELGEGRRVIALTMDLTAFYHQIDSSFLLDDRFLERSGYLARNGPMSAEELTLTQRLIGAFATWGLQLPNRKPSDPIGVPVGPSAPRVIANVLLAEFDALIEQSLSPVYYGRYVDDIFLILQDPGNLKTADDVLRVMCDRIPQLKMQATQLTLDFDYAKKSRLQFKKAKQRIFMLSGAIGIDFIDTLEAKINEVSSEWRLLPNLEDLEDSPCARALTAAKDSDNDADSLRKADVLSIRRLGLAILLRNLDALAQDLPPKEWRTQRSRLYQFMLNHVLTSERLLDLNEYVPRLLSLAVQCGDWEMADRIVNQVSQVVTQLYNTTNRSENETQWPGFRRHLALALKAAVLRSASLNVAEERIEVLLGQIAVVATQTDEPVSLAESNAFLVRGLLLADLARTPIRQLIMERMFPAISGDYPTSVSADDTPLLLKRFVGVSDFLAAAKLPGWLSEPLLFPTRPLSPADVAALVPQCVENTSLWQVYTRVLRGVWVKLATGPNALSANNSVLDLGGPDFNRKPRVCVTSFFVDTKSWSLAVADTPDLSAERYMRLMQLTNQILSAESKPDYVLFPELSVPRRWVGRLVSRLLPAGISLIAGVEYNRLTADPNLVVVNEAKLYLTDWRLGYRAHVAITQRKGIPAHGERDELRGAFGAVFPPPESPICDKRVYCHRGVYFGVLLCSELSDILHRHKFLGAVDAAFVLSWNRDLDSFASMIEASALDLHCFMVLVNNRAYGDSRIRAPFREHWRRDLVRVKGGMDDYFVVAELSVMPLRKFQSHHEPPLDGDFKPTPEGYRIKPYRYCPPGT